MEVNFYSNVVVICIVCSDAVVIRYLNKRTNQSDFDDMYLLRVTTCYTCKKKIVVANINRRAVTVNTSSKDIFSDDDIIEDLDMDADISEDINVPMNERVYDGYNTPINHLVITSTPMFKRMSRYLNGRLNPRTLNGFCIIESLSTVMPDVRSKFAIMSVIVGVHVDKKMAQCGCVHDEMKEDVLEIPYEDMTFFDQMVW
jgi:hypothetical protein